MIDAVAPVMLKAKESRKLRLSKDSLRRLDPGALREVAGGGYSQQGGCDKTGTGTKPTDGTTC